MTIRISYLILFILGSLMPNALSALVTKAGTIDSSFSVSCFSKSVPSVKAFVIQSDGKIVSDIGAYNSNNCAQTIGRFNTNGTLDNSFLSPFSISDDAVLAIANQSDGKIIVGGKFGSGNSRFSVARLNTNGTFDSSFTRNFQSNIIYVAALALLSDEKILVGGYASSSNNLFRTYFNRLNSDGTVDSSFTPGASSEGGILAIAVQADGKYLVGGAFNNYLGTASPFIARLESNGARDASFQSPFTYSNFFTYVGAVSLLSDGKILTAGRFRYNGMTESTPNPVLLRLNTNGLRDVTFKSSGDEKGQNIGHSIALQPDGKILLASDFGLFRFNANGTADTAFGPSAGKVVAFNLTSVALQDDKRIVVGGGFPAVGSKTNLHGLARMFNDPVTSIATLTTNSNGSISPNLNGQLLEIGKFYTVTAKPAAGYLFAEWSDSSRNPKLSFQMISNLNLVAYFVPNPFLQSLGTYSGLFYDTNQPAHDSSGLFNIKVANKGKFSGKIWSAGLAYPMTGQFYVDQTAQITVARRGKTPLQISFGLTNEQVLGNVNAVSFTNDLFGHRATFLLSKSATNFAGKYNFVLPGANDSSPAPSGHSFASTTVSANGNISIKGVLSDGTSFSQKTFLAENGEMPLYIPLYKGSGSIFGWLTFTNSDAGDLHGGLLWTKTSAALGKIYPAGFTNTADILGSRYNATSAVPLLQFTNAIALLNNGNLPDSLTNNIVLDLSNKVAVTSTNSTQFKLTTIPRAGQFKGSFLNPGSGKVSLINGVLLQKQNIGAGFFLGTNQSGSVYLGEPENASLLD